jgi:hypothetical protein
MDSIDVSNSSNGFVTEENSSVMFTEARVERNLSNSNGKSILSIKSLKAKVKRKNVQPTSTCSRHTTKPKTVIQ